jgi:isoamylase
MAAPSIPQVAETKPTPKPFEADQGPPHPLGTLAGFESNPDLHVMMNMYWSALNMDIPAIKGRKWTRAVDTSLASPDDISDPGKEAAINDSTYRVNGRSVVVLVNKTA